jgi:hypothetical protein
MFPQTFMRSTSEATRSRAQPQDPAALRPSDFLTQAERSARSALLTTLPAD